MERSGTVLPVFMAVTEDYQKDRKYYVHSAPKHWPPVAKPDVTKSSALGQMCNTSGCLYFQYSSSSFEASIPIKTLSRGQISSQMSYLLPQACPTAQSQSGPVIQDGDFFCLQNEDFITSSWTKLFTNLSEQAAAKSRLTKTLNGGFSLNSH